MGNVGVMNGATTMGAFNFSGDPTIWSLNGPLNITTAPSVGSPLALLSGGDVIIAGGLNISTLASGPLTIVAGAKLVPNPANATQAPGVLGPNETVKVTGASATGGDVIVGNSTLSAGSVSVSSPLTIAAYSGLT